MQRSERGEDRLITLNASATIPIAAPEPDVEPHQLRTDVTAIVRRLVGDPPGLELTSSCTHAMEAAALVLGLGPGDEVVVPAFTFPSTANAFLLGGVCWSCRRVADGSSSRTPPTASSPPTTGCRSGGSVRSGR